MKIGDVLDLLKRDGWYLVATKGSPRQFKHPAKPGRVTVAGKPSDDLAPGTFAAVTITGAGDHDLAARIAP